MPDNAGRAGIGTPAQLREHLRGYEKAGIEQVIFVQQVPVTSTSANRSKRLPPRSCRNSPSASRPMPSGSVASWRRRSKRRSPASRACLRWRRRRSRWSEALGRQGASPLQGTSDRGGAIPIATADLLAERPGLAAAAAAHALTRQRQRRRRRRRRGSTGAEFVRRLPVTALGAGRARSERVQVSSQWTRRWREMDSNHRYRIRNNPFWLPPFGPAIRLPQQKPALSCRGPMVRIRLPPALSPLRTSFSGGKRGKVRGDDKGRSRR